MTNRGVRPQTETGLATLEWCDLGDMPEGVPVDVLYVNETLEPASCGILYSARTLPGHSFFMTDEGAKVPAIYCVGWRPARRRRPGVAPFLEIVQSDRRPGAA